MSSIGMHTPDYRTLKRREQAYRETLLANSKGFLEVNLTQGFIEGDIVDLRDPANPVVLNPPIAQNPIRYDDFERWWASAYLVSDPVEFLQKSNCPYLLKQYYAGTHRVDVICQSRMKSGGVSDNRQSYFLSEDEETGDIYAFCLVYDLSLELESKRNAQQLERSKEAIAAQMSSNASLSFAVKALIGEYEVLHLLLLDSDMLQVGGFSTSRLSEFMGTEDAMVSYSQKIRLFAQELVAPEDRELFLESTSLSNIREMLATRKSYSVWFTLLLQGSWHTREMRFIRYSNEDMPDAVLLGIIDRDGVQEDLEREYALFKNMSDVLSDDYSAVYYVNVKSGSYIEFESNGDYRTLGTKKQGTDFFGDFDAYARRAVFADDLALVLELIAKGRKGVVIEGEGGVSYLFRLVIGGEVVYHKAVARETIDAQGRHYVIGIMDVDDQVREAQRLASELDVTQRELEAASGKVTTYLGLASVLSMDYESFYYIDLRTDDYKVFGLAGGESELALKMQGPDFFNWVQRNISAIVYSQDQRMVSMVFRKDWLLKMIDSEGSYTMIARFLVNGEPLYYQGRIAYARGGKSHLVIGIQNIDEAVQKELTIERVTNELIRARVKNSTSQMHPHFLYNALGSIREIILEDPEYAVEMIVDFTTHLRACVRSMSNDAPVPFAQELETIKAYVNIEKMRFGERLNVVYQIEDDNFDIVPLSVQPLVENAIRHGIYERPEGGTVYVRAYQGREYQIVEVDDNGIGFDLKEIERQVLAGERDSTGIQNLRFRLAEMMEAEVMFDSRVGKGTTARILIPLNRSKGLQSPLRKAR